jgi:hypothetical protein
VHHAHHSVIDGGTPLVVGQLLESSTRAWPYGVDEYVQLTVPALAQPGEGRLDAGGVGGVGDDAEGLRAAAAAELDGDSAREPQIRGEALR